MKLILKKSLTVLLGLSLFNSFAYSADTDNTHIPQSMSELIQEGFSFLHRIAITCGYYMKAHHYGEDELATFDPLFRVCQRSINALNQKKASLPQEFWNEEQHENAILLYRDLETKQQETAGMITEFYGKYPQLKTIVTQQTILIALTAFITLYGSHSLAKSYIKTKQISPNKKWLYRTIKYLLPIASTIGIITASNTLCNSYLKTFYS